MSFVLKVSLFFVVVVVVADFASDCCNVVVDCREDTR